ncbi:MAG: Butyryl-CoA dehydrogenase [uncultured Pseudonocardia sp.]|uniref:Butyryl-CoA dehydrogenase n=1 Tax=uncultured Pseudonocardia sp. TaxID=211455 RepID=A0A6J4QGN5_9PSEU|nr:MAG: Butyryl-CoA dehydrogenase [uncultured Pseudonocardia sp.]
MIGTRAVAETAAALDGITDPESLELAGPFDSRTVDRLRAAGLYSLRGGSRFRRTALSPLNAHRVIESVASRCVPAAVSMAVHHGFGAPAYLDLLGEGELRSLILDLVERGGISGDADTEPAGAVNRRRTTTAVRSQDGSEYILNGEKVYIQNAPIADLLRVSATLVAGGTETIGLFFVPTASAGVSVGPVHTFVGMRGVPNAPLHLRDVRVPAAYRLDVTGSALDVDEEWRLLPALNDISVRARMYAIAAPSVALATGALQAMRRFVARRTADGSALADYRAVQQMLSESAAEIHAMRALVSLCLLSDEKDPAAVRSEQAAAKNLTSVACGRVVEHAVSLLGAQGVETAAGKAARGVDPLPAERYWRDARLLRISGGVDFQIDNWFAANLLLPPFVHDRAAVVGDLQQTDQPDDAVLSRLSQRNRDHVQFVSARARDLAEACLRLTGGRGLDELTADEESLIAVARWASELLSMTVVLAAAASGSGDQVLTDVHCWAARARVADAASRMARAHDAPDHASVVAGLLGVDGPGVTRPVGDRAW